MARYAAFLRGIFPTNPNMRNENLRKLFEKLGFANVTTVISSGNVLFGSKSKNIKKLEAMIEKALPNLGFRSITIIRSKEQLQQLTNKNPFKGMENTKSRLNVTFLKNELKTSLKFPYRAGSCAVLGIYENAVYSSVDLTGTRDSDLMLWLEKQFGKEITTRTWKTVNRILSKL